MSSPLDMRTMNNGGVVEAVNIALAKVADNIVTLKITIHDLAMVIPQDYRDAAEFEARVSRYIAENASELDMISNNLQFLDGFKAKSLAWYILREARIAVEEEMDNERNHA